MGTLRARLFVLQETKRAAPVLLALLLLLVILGIVWLGLRPSRYRLNSPAIVTEIKRLNELATVRYSIQRVVGIKEPKTPLGEESILIMVQGEAIAGVDLTGFTRDDVTISKGGSIGVTLPPAKLLRTYLDEDQTKIWDRSITWWTPWVPYDPDLEHRARLQALAEVKNTALKMGILDQAEKNAEAAIRDFLAAFELTPQFRHRSV